MCRLSIKNGTLYEENKLEELIEEITYIFRNTNYPSIKEHLYSVLFAPYRMNIHILDKLIC